MEADYVADNQSSWRGNLYYFPAAMVLPLKRPSGLWISIVDECMFVVEKIVGMGDLPIIRKIIGGCNGDDSRS